MVLEALEIANGILMIILDFITITVGSIITSKYIKYKQRALLFVGLAWIFMVSPWFPGAISFILVLTTGQYLSPVVYLIIGNVFVPLAFVLWMMAFTDLVYKKGQKVIIIIFTIYGVIFYIIFFYLLSLDPLLIGEVKGIDVKYGDFIAIYLVSLLVVVLITGIQFARNANKKGDPEVRLKSQFLLVAFILFVIGSMLDALLTLDWVTLGLFRGFEIASTISFYFGFILPPKVKKLFLKEET